MDDAVSLADAEILEHIGELLHSLPQLLIGIGANFAGLAFPDQRRFVLARRLHVAIEAVVGEINLTADEPLGPGHVPLQNLVPLLEPVEFFGGTGPEFFRLLDRLFVESFILGQALDLRLLRKLCGGRKAALLVENRIDVHLRYGFGHGSSSDMGIGDECCLQPWAGTGYSTPQAGYPFLYITCGMNSLHKKAP